MILAKHLEELNKWYNNIPIDHDSEPLQILKRIEDLGLTFMRDNDYKGNVCMVNSPEVRDDYKVSFTPLDLLDYIYATLHSPSYVATYRQFPSIDFSKVPYPKNPNHFWNHVGLGSELRQLHLLESPKVKEYNTSYPIEGDHRIFRKLTKTSPGFEPNVRSTLSSALKTSSVETPILGKVWINETQYFDNVPQTAWEFYMGGCQPAQKWLKDRKGRTLDNDDILYYQKIIMALTETHRLMQEIDTQKIN